MVSNSAKNRERSASSFFCGDFVPLSKIVCNIIGKYNSSFWIIKIVFIQCHFILQQVVNAL